MKPTLNQIYTWLVTSCYLFKGKIYCYYSNGTSNQNESASHLLRCLTNSNSNFPTLTTVSFVFRTFHACKCSIIELDYKSNTAGSVYIQCSSCKWKYGSALLCSGCVPSLENVSSFIMNSMFVSSADVLFLLKYLIVLAVSKDVGVYDRQRNCFSP